MAHGTALQVEENFWKIASITSHQEWFGGGVRHTIATAQAQLKALQVDIQAKTQDPAQVAQVQNVLEQLATAQDFVDSQGKGIIDAATLALQQASALEVHRRDHYLSKLKKDLPEATLHTLRAAPLGQSTLFGADLVEAAITTKRKEHKAKAFVKVATAPTAKVAKVAAVPTTSGAKPKKAPKKDLSKENAALKRQVAALESKPAFPAQGDGTKWGNKKAKKDKRGSKSSKGTKKGPKSSQ
jgi:hypothetical protein